MDISIIVPIYNTEEYLNQCLSSILKCKSLTIEVLVIDDASTDNGLYVLSKIASQDNRVTIISLEKNTPGGAGIPSNIGIRKAQGKYIGFVDSDDWIHEGMFESLFAEAERTGADFVFCDFNQYDEITKEYICSYDNDRWGGKGHNGPIDYLNISPVPWRKLYKREFLISNSLYFPEGDFFYEDMPFHFIVTASAERIGFVEDVLYTHRVQREGQTMAGNGEKFLVFLQHYRYIYDFLITLGYEKSYFIQFIQFILDNAYWVWDRLAKPERKIFFYQLSEIVLNIDEQILFDYKSSHFDLDRVRFEYLIGKQFLFYSITLLVYKYEIFFIQRNLYFLKTHGWKPFFNKIKNKLRVVIS